MEIEIKRGGEMMNYQKQTHYKPSEFGDFEVGSTVTISHCGDCNDIKKKLNTAISALKKIRNMDTWQNVKQINDFIDETLEKAE